MIRILSFSTNRDILPVMDRLVNKQEGWEGRRAADLATAERLLDEEDFDLVLLGAGTGEAELQHLRARTQVQGKAVRFVVHYGGGSGLLYNEVAAALATD